MGYLIIPSWSNNLWTVKIFNFINIIKKFNEKSKKSLNNRSIIV